jgi:phosphatidylglycerol lysyltransferase
MVARAPRANGALSLEPGLRIFGGPSGAVTWAGSGRTAFAAGGVLGENREGMLRGFSSSLKAAGYRRALLFPLQEDEREACQAGHFPSIHVGMEAFLTNETFGLAGKRYVDLRQMLNRAKKRHGLAVWEVHPPKGREGLEALHGRWLLTRPTWKPMALVVGSPCFDAPLGRRYFAVGAQGSGVAQAFITVTPGWSGDGWGLDVMARDPGASAGAMELVITETIGRLFDEGANLFSLGAAPLYPGPGKAAGGSHRLERIMGWIYRNALANRFFHFKALARFKMKFAPQWEPVYIGMWPKPSFRALYGACRMWGLFGEARLDSPRGGSLEWVAGSARMGADE